MHVLVTGSAGMIGRKLVERLVHDKSLNDKAIDPLDTFRRRARDSHHKAFRLLSRRQIYRLPALPRILSRRGLM